MSGRFITRVLAALWAAGLGGCTAASFLAASLPAASEDHHATRDLPYGALARQKLDLYRPSLPASKPVPVIVFLHGGRWSFGEKGQYEFVGAALAGRGFLAVLRNYRLNPEVRLSGFADDVAAAIVWAHEHASEYGGDPAQLCVMGHSAGAHLAAPVTLDEHYLRARGLDPARCEA